MIEGDGAPPPLTAGKKSTAGPVYHEYFPRLIDRAAGLYRMGAPASSLFEEGDGKYRIVNDENTAPNDPSSSSRQKNLVTSLDINSDSDSPLTDLPSDDDDGSFGHQEFVDETVQSGHDDDDGEQDDAQGASRLHDSQHQHTHREHDVKFSGIKLTLTDLNKKRASDLAVLADVSRSRPESFRFQCPALSCGARLVGTTVYKDFAKARPDSQWRTLRHRNEPASFRLPI